MFYRALRYGFARCSHALCADVLPTFSKVGARAALAKKNSVSFVSRLLFDFAQANDCRKAGKKRGRLLGQRKSG